MNKSFLARSKSDVHTIVAIDFDETIAINSKFPHIERERKGAIKYIRKLWAKGYYIVVWTCRHGEHQEQAEIWLQDNRIPFDQINQHHPALIEFYGNDTRKIAADLYVDDKNLMWLPPWWLIYYMIRIRTFFSKKKQLSVIK